MIDGLAVVAVVLGGLTGVVTFLPAQGFVATPLREGLVTLLGRSVFVLPLLLLLSGVVRLAHVPIPRARLTGLGLLLTGVLVSEHLLRAGDAGLIGQWLSNMLLDAVGGIATAVLLLAILAVGGLLTFGVRLGWR
jgi:type IV secretory pathway VirB2 component (pilin)